MKSNLALLLTAAGLALGQPAFAQDAPKTGSADKPAAPPASADKPMPTPAELEARFKATLTQATFAGRWCSIKDGKLGPEKEDKYTILSVTKIGLDVWTINARIEYNQKNIVAPIPVQVKWAGDTPVIIVDKVGVPGSGTYSARVMIYENTYAGTWTGGDHGGLMSGVITKKKN